ncbi:TPA: sodium:calcium antiporter [Candidatus Woesearchaeota archaeon]|nr:K+-dependent Na+/Ca+ exchanger related-protein [archaeon GW2011_AR15]MBS3104336.1 sodium:calcium antiporter [Candidatus Woesearchaeota archaeon]HIH40880.1 sodium:calcium antiporter [Candidatus Woesearchaeota archaeon]
MLLVNLAVFIVGCLILVKSSSVLVKSLAKIASFLNLNEFTIGFIIVAVATSLPETFIGIMSALDGTPELSAGNVIGANVLDLTLIIGIAVLLAKRIDIESKIVKKDMIFMLLLAFLPVVLMIDHYFWSWIGLFPGMVPGISRMDGVVLLAVFVYYIYRMVRQETRFSKTVDHTTKKELAKDMLLFLISIVFMLGSSQFVVGAAENLSIELNLSPLLIGLFLVSFGTTMPEMVFTSKAALAGHTSMAVGDLVGSIITNSTLVLGMTAIITPIQLNSLLYVTSTLFMLFSAFIFFTFAESDNGITLNEGLSLIMLYVLFVIIEMYIKYNLL